MRSGRSELVVVRPLVITIIQEPEFWVVCQMKDCDFMVGCDLPLRRWSLLALTFNVKEHFEEEHGSHKSAEEARRREDDHLR